MNYFLKKNKRTTKRGMILARRKRKPILGIPAMGKKITRGDIFTVDFWNKALHYSFEGIILAHKKKSFVNSNVTLKLRNVLLGTGVELTASYFFNRLFRSCVISDYKRKSYDYRSSKLYYLCLRKNKATRIK